MVLRPPTSAHTTSATWVLKSIFVKNVRSFSEKWRFSTKKRFRSVTAAGDDGAAAANLGAHDQRHMGLEVDLCEERALLLGEMALQHEEALPICNGRRRRWCCGRQPRRTRPAPHGS